MLVWLFSPRPFLAELLDDATGVTDIHLVLSLQLLGVCTGILMSSAWSAGFVPGLARLALDPIEALRYE